MSITLALAGNPNSGKSTLFNLLTGGKQHVGNWPGVTVEKKSGSLRGRSGITVVDLPGVYALSPFSMEERIARDFLASGRADVIIHILDAACLERSLYLTLQLMQLERPVILALNMMDEVRARGDRIDAALLSRRLRLPAISLCARSGEGAEMLVTKAIGLATQMPQPSLNVCTGQAVTAMCTIKRLVEPYARRIGLPASYTAERVFEGDTLLLEQLKLSHTDRNNVGNTLSCVEKSLGMEGAEILADSRYRLIALLLKDVYVRGGVQGITARIDGIALHRLWGLPLFFAALMGVFWLTFGPVGFGLQGILNTLTDSAIRCADAFLASFDVHEGLRSLLSQGIFAGIGSVLSFMPTMLVLFLCLSVLEDSGYMARGVFLLDRPLRALGLGGRSFIPLLMGFGCTVPAIMATRTMSSQRDRRLTLMLLPFMSCGAKAPVYAMMTTAFFGGSATVSIFLYVGGVVLAGVAAIILKSAVFREDPVGYLMELPPYRMPTLRTVVQILKDKAGEFLGRVFSVILLSSVVVWLMTRFDPSLNAAMIREESILWRLAGALTPLFAPLGFGNPQTAAALITGLFAKESIVSTLCVLLGVQEGTTGLSAALRLVFPGKAEAASFLAFVLLYAPCTAAFSAMRKELGGLFRTLTVWVVQCAAAWICAFAVYQAAHLC